MFFTFFIWCFSPVLLNAHVEVVQTFIAISAMKLQILMTQLHSLRDYQIRPFPLKSTYITGTEPDFVRPRRSTRQLKVWGYVNNNN